MSPVSWVEQADVRTGRAGDTFCSSWKSQLHISKINFVVNKHILRFILRLFVCGILYREIGNKNYD